MQRIQKYLFLPVCAFKKSIWLQLFLLSVIAVNTTQAQDSVFIRGQIEKLCSPEFSGRGYVDSGVQKAALYIARIMDSLGLKPLPREPEAVPAGLVSPYAPWFQHFHMNVNTLPGAVELKYRGGNKKPGVDYLVDAYSPGVAHLSLKTRIIDLDNIKDSTAWTQLAPGMNDRTQAYVLLNTDSFQKRIGWRPRQMAAALPAGVFILPKRSKPLWWPGTEVNNATVIYWFDTFQNIQNNKKIFLNVEQKFEQDMQCQNVIGYVPGMIDSYVVFTAHYDHLGKMGQETMFPGASDNASGTAMMLSLAKYFAAHPQRYHMLFLAFGGEEAGLVGSEYFVKHPLVNLKKICFLINTDIMGDGSDGIAVVNATRHEAAYEMLKSLNPITNIQADTTYLFKEIRKGGPAANSDHHYFSEAGVPAFFIFSIGGKGFYHDPWDQPHTLSLNNIDAARRLLISFAEKLQNGK